MTTPETRGTILDRIRTRVAAGLRSDEGFVLLDVLIGIAVLALLLLTAIQSIGPMRQRSYQSSTQSDARQVATAIEASITDNGSAGAPTTAALTQATLATVLPDINLSSGNEIGWYKRNLGDPNAFVVCILHRTGTGTGTVGVDAASFYNSAKGAIVESRRANHCGVVPDDTEMATLASQKGEVGFETS